MATVVFAGPVSAPSADQQAVSSFRPFQQNLVVNFEQVSPAQTPESYVQRQIAFEIDLVIGENRAIWQRISDQATDQPPCTRFGDDGGWRTAT
jgi:hypothetical protein